MRGLEPRVMPLVGSPEHSNISGHHMLPLLHDRSEYDSYLLTTHSESRLFPPSSGQVMVPKVDKISFTAQFVCREG